MNPFVRWRTAPVLAMAIAAPGLSAAACSATGDTATGSVRTVVVLTADQAAEIVVPAGFASATTSIPNPSVTTVPATDTSSSDAVPSETGSSSSEPSASGTSQEGTDEADAVESSDGESDPQVPATTVVVATTVVEVVKETVPLAEEDRVHPGVRLMSALDEFNACLAEEGHEWIGFPDAAQGPEALVNQPAYLEALQLCNSRTGISDAYQDYQTSRSGLSPEEIRQENEDFIDLVDCLRRLGWSVSDLRPDEDGLLNPGDEFAGPDGGIVTDDIRDCASEIALAAETEE